MNMPGFDAKSSLEATFGSYRAQSAFGRSPAARVLPMMGKTCGPCTRVGGLGSISGVGLMACGETEWRYRPRAREYQPTTVTSIEACSPEPVVSRWFSF